MKSEFSQECSGKWGNGKQNFKCLPRCVYCKCGYFYVLSLFLELIRLKKLIYILRKFVFNFFKIIFQFAPYMGQTGLDKKKR